MDKQKILSGLNSQAPQFAPSASWNDLNFLPQTQLTLLHEIVTHILQALPGCRETVSRLQNQGGSILFTGPGKSAKGLAAALIAKDLGRTLQRIGLSALTGKYIGETEKNLARLLDEAESKNWILFFDEADALFGRRSEARDSHDRYANMETGILLQKIEAYAGLAILATNAESSLDQAFLRRFRYVVNFPLPAGDERNEMWHGVLPGNRKSP